jgi:hypothetical protein
MELKAPTPDDFNPQQVPAARLVALPAISDDAVKTGSTKPVEGE